MSYDSGSGYVVGTSGGAMNLDSVKSGLSSLLDMGGWVVPGWTKLSTRVREASVPTLIGLLIVAVMFGVLAWYGLGGIYHRLAGFQGMSVQSLGNPAIWGPGGAAGTALIQLSDPNHDPKFGSDMKQAFLNQGSGPEFAEQPNYVLGNENMQRTALNQFARLKAKGLVNDWPTFWADYRANHADDLDVSLYDFNDGMAGDRPDHAHVSASLKRASTGFGTM